MLGHRALRAEPERDARGLRRAREIAIDRGGLGGAAGHAGDHERRGEALADELGRQVDVVERELGQRLVDELDVLEQRRARELGAPRGGDLEVVGLAPGDRAARLPRRAFYANCWPLAVDDVQDRGRRERRDRAGTTDPSASPRSAARPWATTARGTGSAAMPSATNGAV